MVGSDAWKQYLYKEHDHTLAEQLAYVRVGGTVVGANVGYGQYLLDWKGKRLSLCGKNLWEADTSIVKQENRGGLWIC